MTTIISPDGVTEVINARRTESLDAPSIQRLVTANTNAVFGRTNVIELIEKALLAVTLSNSNEDILAHAAFYDYPNHNFVDQAEWEDWLHSRFMGFLVEKATAVNSLFLHHFVAKEEYAEGCTKEIIQTVFNAVPDIHYIFLVLQPGCFPDQSLNQIFSELLPRTDHNPSDGTMFVCRRYETNAVLHVRQAKVEDHDDLTPIFNRQNDMLKKTYGDFFLAELIEGQDDHLHCLAAEVTGTAIGFMSVSDNVNTEFLERCFELGAFHGLRKHHADDKLVPSPPPSVASEPPASVDRSSHSQTGSEKESQKSGSASDKVSEAEKANDAQSQDIVPKLSDSVQGSAKSSLIGEELGDVAGSPKDEEEVVQLEGDLEEADAAEQEDIRSPSVASPIASPERMTPQLPPCTATARPRAQIRFRPEFHGESNACVIQLFAIDERYEMRSVDFLPKIFELFPNCEFVLLTVPHLVPEFPLLQNFVRVSPRPESTISQELYVFHKAALSSSFSVRRACTSDFPSVKKLVGNLYLSSSLLGDFNQYNKYRRDDDGRELQAFVAECAKQVIGVAIIRREENMEYLRAHFNLEDFVYYNHHSRDDHGHIYHLAMNPIFNHLGKTFIKEIMRLGHKTCLHYPVFPDQESYETERQSHTLITSLNDMVPVRARRQVIYSLDKLGGNAPTDRVLKKEAPFALNHINRKLILEPKVTINARIVVVGASTTSIAFLEALAFCPHLRFNNLVLISPHGLPGDLPPDELRESMLSTNHCYNYDDYSHLALRTWVNLVYGKMTGINRKKKHVAVNGTNGGTMQIVPYDHLVLATGLQYVVPCPTGADVSKLATSHEIPQPATRRFTGDSPPKNLFVVNDSYEAAVALYWLEQHFLQSEGRAIVFGADLKVFTCVQSLLDLGVPGQRIALVKPPPEKEISAFNDPQVEAALAAELRAAGVSVYGDDGGFLLAQWNEGHEEEPELIYSASFTSDTKPLTLECSVFFCFFQKMVDVDSFRAINDACLVFDGRLVIDAYSHTNDVSIRGVGPLTKFQRAYHSDQWGHARFNSKEVGEQLAQTMLRLFDPTLEPESAPPVEPLKLIPMLEGPKVQGGQLPGGMQYLNVAKPGLDIAQATLMTHSDYGRVLITGSPDGNPGYFRLHINQYNTIETITCLSKNPFPASNLIRLYGVHQRFLNNLVSRYDEGLIKDLYDYFTEPWCMAIFHDRFSDFRDEVRELLLTRASPERESIEECVRKMMEDDIGLSVAQREELLQEFAAGGAKRAVETRFLSYISYNYYHLPMYAKPEMV